MPREPNAAIMAATGLGRSLWAHCAVIEEPRRAEKVVCPLPEILLLLLAATLAGADDLVEVRLWGRQHLAFLRRCLPFRRGIRRHDRLGDVIHAIDRAPGAAKPCVWSRPLQLVEAERAGQPSIARRYHLSSMALDAASFACAVRAHSGIESRGAGSWTWSSAMTSPGSAPATAPDHGHHSPQGHEPHPTSPAHHQPEKTAANPPPGAPTA